MKYLGLIAALVLGGCGGDGITGGQRTVAALQGTWSMTRFQLVNAADSTDRVDPLPSGTSGILTVTSAGAFTFTVGIPGDVSRTETGSLSLRGDTLTYDGEGDEVAFLLVLTGNSMTWRALEAELFDLNGDGVPEETYTRVTFVRA
jgi:hypothetical protein